MNDNIKNEIKQMLDTDDAAIYFNKLKKTEHPTWGQQYAYRAWRDTVENNADMFEVRELPWGNNLEADTPEFVKTLHEAGIDHFVVTDESTALMRGLHALIAAGCIIEGAATVTRRPPDWNESTHIGLEVRIADSVDAKDLELGYSLRSLGEQLVKDCPENDCIIYRNIYTDYQRSIEQYKEVAGSLDNTLLCGMRKALRERKAELMRMYAENYAIQQYKGK